MKWTRMSRMAAAAVVLGLALAGCGSGSSTKESADVVFRNGYVATLDAAGATAQAVAVKNGTIVYVGTDARAGNWIGAATRVIDLGGRMLMPGLVDAHVHALAGGRALMQCDLHYAPLSHAQLQAQLQACLNVSADNEPGVWMEAVNWDRQSTAAIDGDPGKALLDSLTTSRPIVVTSSDFHTVLANSRALALAHLDDTVANPAGGSFQRDGGRLTGIAEDAAGWLIKDAIPADSDADLLKQGRTALTTLREHGVTTFMDAAAGAGHVRTFKALQQAGELSARANFAFQISAQDAADNPGASVAAARALIASADQGAPTAQPGLNARTVKLFMDGVVNAPADTGALLTPYFTNTNTGGGGDPHWVPGSNFGALYFPPAVLKPLLLALNDGAMDVHVHATGEAAVRQTLDAIEYVRAQRPAGDLRAAIAHAETVAVADYPRFAALGVTATMSFQWAQRAPYSIGETEHHLGPDRFARMEPFGSLHNAGARIAYGSDWPIDPYDTMLALKAGVTRAGDPANPNSAASVSPVFEGPINADPALSRLDTLKAITINAAYQLRLEKRIGSIEVGKFADMIVLEKNFMTVPDEELGRNRVLLTMVGGKIVMAINVFANAAGTLAGAIGDVRRGVEALLHVQHRRDRTEGGRRQVG